MSVGLIVPDVHERITKLKSVLKEYEYVDWVVFIGDFMDSFDLLTWNTHETIKWLRDNLGNPKYRFIWGNHDLHYAFPVDGVICSGYDPNKQLLLDSHLNHKFHWSQFSLKHWIGNADDPQETQWLCSHAGLHPYLLHPIKGFDRDALQEMEDEAMDQLQFNQKVLPLIAPGRGRGGYARVGGLTWLDWDREFVPVPGLNQIVGHSPDKTVRVENTADSTNYCIDTHLRHVVVVTDGNVVVKDV
jgi:hypothetical protein